MTREQEPDHRADLRASIVDAASRLLRERGAQAVTTRAVAALAGVQAPTIYRIFGDKAGLVDAVAEQVMQAYVTDKTTSSARADGDPVEELRTAWQRHVDFGLANADLYALLNTPGRSAHSPATTTGIEVLRTRIRRIAAAGRLRVEEDRAVDMVHAAGAGAVLTLLARPADERDLGLADAMFEIVAQGVLATTSPASADTTVPAVTNAFLTVLADLPALTEAERTLMGEWVARSLARMR